MSENLSPSPYAEQSRRVTRQDAINALTIALPRLGERQPWAWACVRKAQRQGRTEGPPGESDVERFTLELFRCPCPGGHVGRDRELGLSWNLGVRVCWDTVEEHEVKQLVIGVWREDGDGLVMGSVRQWCGNSALDLVNRALQELAEDQQ